MEKTNILKKDNEKHVALLSLLSFRSNWSSGLSQPFNKQVKTTRKHDIVDSVTPDTTASRFSREVLTNSRLWLEGPRLRLWQIYLFAQNAPVILMKNDPRGVRVKLEAAWN